MQRHTLLVCAAALAWSGAAVAQENESVAEFLERCRSIENDAARLACFDLVVNGRSDLGEVTRSTVPRMASEAMPTAGALPSQTTQTEAEREASFFGRFIPRRGLEDDPRTSPLEQPAAPQGPTTEVLERDESGVAQRVGMTISEVRTVGYNTVRFHMENGQIWEVTDNRRVWIPDESDGPLIGEIRRGFIGSHYLQINGTGRAIRVRRID